MNVIIPLARQRHPRLAVLLVRHTFDQVTHTIFTFITLHHVCFGSHTYPSHHIPSHLPHPSNSSDTHTACPLSYFLFATGSANLYTNVLFGALGVLVVLVVNFATKRNIFDKKLNRLITTKGSYCHIISSVFRIFH